MKHITDVTDANHYIKTIFRRKVQEKKQGKNHDLTVAEYKVAKEGEKIESSNIFLKALR